MKKQLIVGLSILAAGAVLWALFARDSAPQDSAVDKSILAIRDERLTKGDSQAPVAVVEYVDMLCPYCAKVHNEVLPQLEKDYIESGKVRYEVRLVGMLTLDSQRAAEGAYCAAEQGKFWDYTDAAYDETWSRYYSRGVSPTDIPLFRKANIAQFADRVGLDVARWESCVEGGKYAEVIGQNQLKMTELGASGTPYFLFNGQGYSGAPPYPIFQKTLDAELAKEARG